MNIQQRNVFVCSDGEMFNTMEEAREHETVAQISKTVNEYRLACIDAGLNARTANRRASTIAQYLEWQVNGKIAGADEVETEHTEAA